MHCIRRTALRAALSSSRQAAPKTAAAPSIAYSALRITASTQGLLPSPRCFSQTARARNSEETNHSAPIPDPANVDIVGVMSEHGVFVRNVLFSVTSDQLKTAFEKFGTVTGASIARDSRGLSRGYGFVYFGDGAAAEEAIANVDGSFWHGRRVTCTRKAATKPRPRSTQEPSEVLYIGNIPYETTDAELNRIFRDLPNLRDIRVAVDRTTGWPRGFAHATFTNVEAAEHAFDKLSGAQIGSRILKVDFAAGRLKPKTPVEKEASDF